MIEDDELKAAEQQWRDAKQALEDYAELSLAAMPSDVRNPGEQTQEVRADEQSSNQRLRELTEAESAARARYEQLRPSR